MGSIMDAAILHHVCIVLVLLWVLNSFNYRHPIFYFLSLIYLYLVHEVYVTKLKKKLQFEEMRESQQRRVLSGSESVRWLNHAIEKMWSVCMEEIVSQKILLPIVPWFLQKYKPWTVKDVEVHHLYLGRSPPMFTDIRVLPNPNSDDHLVMELGMNFRTADDMSAVLGVKLRKRLGFGMPVKLHLVGMHVEGKVLVGVKFLRKWPFIGRMRVCFSSPPYFQMIVKPIFTHGLNVTELPGIAGWIDNLLAVVFEQTLVEPNMLVVDVEKFVSPEPENWFSVDTLDPVAHVLVEVLEAADMNPSDMNGLADPYVKGCVGPYKFRTRIQKKTLAPKWQEEFKIPIVTWELENTLDIEVRDKDRLYDDTMGKCRININEFRDGQRYDMWLPLMNIKMGRLHLAVTVSEYKEKDAVLSCDAKGLDGEDKTVSLATDSVKKGSFSSKTSENSPKVADEYEPIGVAGYSETGVWIHHPRSEVVQVWEPRKGKLRNLDCHQINGEDSVRDSKFAVSKTSPNDDSSTDGSVDASKPHSTNSFRKGLKKISSVFHRSPKPEDKPLSPQEAAPLSPQCNIRELNDKEVGVRFTLDGTLPPSLKIPKGSEDSAGGNVLESPQKGHVKDMAKSILKHAGKSARGLKHSFSRKSRKCEPESGSLAMGETISDPDSSDEECSEPADVPRSETVLIVPGPDLCTVATVSGNNSQKIDLDASETIHSSSSFKSSGNTVLVDGTEYGT